jgi:hypothetical protein
MIQTINLYDFRDAFKRYGRGEQFSYEGLELIFDYIEEYEDSTGEQVELDVVALCCEWAEDTPENIAAAYDIDLEGKEGAAALMHVYDYLIDGIDGTQVAGVTDSGTVVYVQF